MRIVKWTTGIVVDGECFAGQRHHCFREGLSAHERKLLARWRVGDLRVSAPAGLLHHAAKGVVRHADCIGLARINSDGVAVRIPRKGMKRVVRGISVVIVGRGSSADAGDAVDGVGICGLKTVGASGFVDVAERIVREGLRCSAYAVCAGHAGDIVVNIRTILSSRAVETVADVLGLNGAVGVPAEDSREGNAVHREFVLGHSVGVGVVVVSIGVPGAGTESQRENLVRRVVCGGGDGILTAGGGDGVRSALRIGAISERRWKAYGTRLPETER